MVVVLFFCAAGKIYCAYLGCDFFREGKKKLGAVEGGN